MNSRSFKTFCCFAIALTLTRHVSLASNPNVGQVAGNQPVTGRRSQQAPSTKSTVQIITRAQLNAQLGAGEKLILVDALPEKYFRFSHLQGSINIPHDKAEELIQRLLPDKKAEIVVYCMAVT